MLMQPFYLGIYRCRTDTTSHEEDLLCLHLIQRLFYQLGRTSQRTYEIMEVFSLGKLCHQFCTGTNGLEHNGYCSFFSVVITDSQRDTLTLAIHSYDDKLTGFTGLCHSVCFYLHKIDVGCQLLFFYDLIHFSFSVPSVRIIYLNDHQAYNGGRFRRSAICTVPGYRHLRRTDSPSL